MKPFLRMGPWIRTRSWPCKWQGRNIHRKKERSALNTEEGKSPLCSRTRRKSSVIRERDRRWGGEWHATSRSLCGPRERFALHSECITACAHVLWLTQIDSTWFVFCCLVTRWCLTLCDPVDYSLPGSSVTGISQAGILEWVAIPYSRGSSWPGNGTHTACTAGRFFYCWATGEPLISLH